MSITSRSSGAIRKRDSYEDVWVYPRRDDLIVQRVLKLGDNLGVTSIEYRPDKAAGWVPTRWTAQVYARRNSTGDLGNNCLDYSINQPIPPGTFDLAFPPRTFVTDAVLNERYLVRADGSQRPVTNNELKLERQRKLRFSDLLKNCAPSGKEAD